MRPKVIETKIENLTPDNLNANKGTEYVSKDFALIYLYRCQETNKPIYVGKTIDINKRIKSHLKAALSGSNSRFHNWLRKNQSAIPEILEVCKYDEWKEREIFWIQNFKNQGYDLKNILIGGQGLEKGHSFSESTLKKMSESATKKFQTNPKLKESYVIKYGKLTMAELENIFHDYHARNISGHELAIKYKVPQSTISNILNGKYYAHLVKYFVYFYGKPTKTVSSIKKDAIIEKVCNEYLKGADIEHLSSKYKRHKVVIFRYIKQGTGKTFQKHEKERIRIKILELYSTTELNNEEISKKIGCDYTLVCKVLKTNKANYEKHKTI